MAKKTIKLILILFLTVIFLFAVRAFIAGLFIPQVIENSLGERDTVELLGDGNFRIGKANNHLVLFDYHYKDGQTRVLSGDIEDYVIKDNIIYIIGEYGEGNTILKDGTRIEPSDYIDYKTGETKFYKPSDPVPQYLILNVNTTELNTYLKLKDIPESERQIFKKMKK